MTRKETLGYSDFSSYDPSSVLHSQCLSQVMDLFREHIELQRGNRSDTVLTDHGLQFADVDPLSSDSELDDLFEDADD